MKRPLIFVIVLWMLAGCSQTNNHSAAAEQAVAPTQEQVIRDVADHTHNIYVGTQTGKDEQIPLASLILEDSEVTMTHTDKEMEAVVSAFIGDQQWKSEAKQTITVDYSYNASKQQWEVKGLNVNNPVIPIQLRSDLA